MKVLIISKYDIEGGAAIAAYRLHMSLIASGVDSCMLVQKKLSQEPTFLTSKSFIQKVLNSLSYYFDQLPVYLYKNKSPYLFSPSWYSSGDILKQINKHNADVVHIHWSCKGMLSISDIKKIRSPVLFTMHDSWLFTGGCHIPWECKKYKQSCGACPELASNRTNDLSRKIFIKKKVLYSTKKDVTLVAVSKWLQDCTKNSTLFKNKEVHCIPNAINTDEYYPVKKSFAKSILRLNPKNKLILFGALSATSDLNKGYEELKLALDKLSSSNIEIAIFGSDRPKNASFSKYKTHYYGRLDCLKTLRNLYSAADVMVVPSKMEAFGQTASEALACGTPAVIFDTTGLRDIVDHKINGYVAKCFDTDDLATGIEWILNSEDYESLTKNSREKVIRCFDSSVVAEQYKELYKNALMKSE